MVVSGILNKQVSDKLGKSETPLKFIEVER